MDYKIFNLLAKINISRKGDYFKLFNLLFVLDSVDVLVDALVAS